MILRSVTQKSCGASDWGIQVLLKFWDVKARGSIQASKWKKRRPWISGEVFSEEFVVVVVVESRILRRVWASAM